jgi:DNA gyrase subunit A
MLVNGAGGIAVGMATNIPPHNLGEVIDATLGAHREPRPLRRRDHGARPRPDFPTGGVMLGCSGARKAYLEGRGSVILRAKTHDESSWAEAIIVDSTLPGQQGQDDRSASPRPRATSASRASLPRFRYIRPQRRALVIELERDATPRRVLTTQALRRPCNNFPVNMLALNGVVPRLRRSEAS